MSARAQDNSTPPPIAFWDRWAVKTNALEWLLTIPNIQLEFDLFPSEYNRFTLLLGGKYNWDTATKFAPYYVFNVLDVRPEFRYHFRLDRTNADTTPAFLKWMVPKRPHPWRAWYVGAYANYGTFSIKPSETGRQGFQTGIGVSTGIEIPLYQYPKGAIDFELGVSVGVLAAKYDSFRLNDDNFTYARVGQPDNNFHILPMVTELRAVFAWRHRSVKERYQETDPAIHKYKQAQNDIEANFRSSTKEEFDNLQDSRTLERYRQNDSLYRADYTTFLEETAENSRRSLQIYKLDAKRGKRLEDMIQARRKGLLNQFDAALLKEKKEEK